MNSSMSIVPLRSWSKKQKKWVVQLKLDKLRYFGSFERLEDAVKKRDAEIEAHPDYYPKGIYRRD